MKPLRNNGESSGPLRFASGLLVLFLLAGCAFSVAHGIARAGFWPQRVAEYYLGSDEEMSYPKELPELLDSTHVHLFMIPLIYFILSHIFAQTALRARWKILLIGATFANILGYLAAPYCIRFLSPGFALLMPVHNILFLVFAGLLAWFPLRETLSYKGPDGQE